MGSHSAYSTTLEKSIGTQKLYSMYNIIIIHTPPILYREMQLLCVICTSVCVLLINFKENMRFPEIKKINIPFCLNYTLYETDQDAHTDSNNGIESPGQGGGGCPESREVQGVATDCSLPLTTARIRIRLESCEKDANDLRLGGGFRRVVLLPDPFSTVYPRPSLKLAKKATLNEIPS